jgi:hypothetical protein
MSDSYYKELRDYADECLSMHLELRIWMKQPALVNKSKMEYRWYDGQEYDPQLFDLVEDAWDHDHCEFCNSTIKDCDCGECVKEAYENDGKWMCQGCFEHLIENGEEPEIYLKKVNKQS